MQNNFSIDITGLDIFTETMQRVNRDLSVETEKALRSVGNGYRRKVKARTPIGRVPNPKSLHRRYSLSRVMRDADGTIKVEFKSKAPHYHLIERGWNVTTKTGQRTGKFVQGVEMVAETSEEYQSILHDEVLKSLRRILKKVN